MNKIFLILFFTLIKSKHYNYSYLFDKEPKVNIDFCGVFSSLKKKNPFVYELKLHDKFLFHIVIITPNFLIKYANCKLPHTTTEHRSIIM